MNSKFNYRNEKIVISVITSALGIHGRLLLQLFDGILINKIGLFSGKVDGHLPTTSKNGVNLTLPLSGPPLTDIPSMPNDKPGTNAAQLLCCSSRSGLNKLMRFASEKRLLLHSNLCG
jgi:hypothetical protein